MTSQGPDEMSPSDFLVKIRVEAWRGRHQTDSCQEFLLSPIRGDRVVWELAFAPFWKPAVPWGHVSGSWLLPLFERLPCPGGTWAWSRCCCVRRDPCVSSQCWACFLTLVDGSRTSGKARNYTEPLDFLLLLMQGRTWRMEQAWETRP